MPATATTVIPTITLEKLPAEQVSGRVITQKSLSPPVETALTRKGIVLFGYGDADYGVGLQTNSRLLGTGFDHEGKKIIAKLEGVQGAAGRSEFAIPKELLAGPFVISLDGELLEDGKARVTENATHATVAFDHEHSLQEVVIQGTSAVPEFPLPAAAAAALTVVAIAMIIAGRRLLSGTTFTR